MQLLRLADLAFVTDVCGLSSLREAGREDRPKGKIYANLGRTVRVKPVGLRQILRKAIKAGVKDEKVAYNLAVTYEKIGNEKAAAALYGRQQDRNRRWNP